VDVTKLICLDESSINLAYARNYGRAKTNQRIREGRKDVRFERQSILSTISLSGKVCPFVFEGTLNKELFEQYIKVQLKPSMSKGEILLLDNSSVHKSKLAIDTLKECGIQYIFLPRYSPDFNPIEYMWNFMKSILRKLKARTRKALEDAINLALTSVSLEYIFDWFNMSGYIVNL